MTDEAPISGLSYLADWIDPAEEAELLRHIDAAAWLPDLKNRRVQHYGFKYDYKARKVDRSFYLGELPEWARPLAERLLAGGWFEKLPDQLIVNEYEPGQGIAPHVDCVPCFGPVVASLSLGSSAMMEFTPTLDTRKAEPNAPPKVEVFLQPRSLVVLSGPARYDWRHAIPARRQDSFDGPRPRSRRVSLTFRTVLLSEE